MQESSLLFGPFELMLRQEGDRAWTFGIVIRRHFGWFAVFGFNYIRNYENGKSRFSLYAPTNLMWFKQIARGVRVEDWAEKKQGLQFMRKLASKIHQPSRGD